MSGNSFLSNAKRNKKDEFYTRLEDIERELVRYRDHFKDKVVFCNCDDPEESNFWWYFKLNFDFLGLKKLITTHYDADNPTYKLVIDGTRRDKDGNPVEVKTKLKGNGDFRNDESIRALKASDIVVTNPPFSLFREYVSQLFEYDKKFIIVGNQNTVIAKDLFPLIKENKMWYGFGFKGGAAHFINKHYVDYATATDRKEGMIRVSGVIWLTNLPHKKRYEDIILVKKYYGNEEMYPRYDNYDAINVDATKDIPYDYPGVMGVPITFLDKYNPEQFEILGLTTGREEFGIGPSKRYINAKQINKDGTTTNGSKANTRATILLDDVPDDKIYYMADNAEGPMRIVYARILIRNRRLSDNED